MNKTADEIEHRTGPLHRVLGITASASDEEVKHALERAHLDQQTQLAAAHLLEPEYREAYEAAVMASRLGATMVVPPDQKEDVFRFAAVMGLRLRPVPGKPDGSTCPSRATNRPPLGTTTAPRMHVSFPRPRRPRPRRPNLPSDSPPSAELAADCLAH